MKKEPKTEQRVHLFTAIVSFAIVLAVILSSCGLIVINYPFDKESTDTTADSESAPDSDTDNPYHIVDLPDNFEKAVKYLSELKSVDMGGTEINIVQVSDFTNVYSDLYQFYNSLNETRDEYIERKYNVKINRTKKRVDVILNEMMDAKRKRQYYADLVLLPASYVGFLQENNAIADVSILEGTDYTAPFFNYDAMLSSSAGEKTFAIIGEASELTESYECIFVNKDLLRSMNLEIPYGAVYSDAWTFDMLSYYADKINEYYSSKSSADTGDQNDEDDTEYFAIGSDLGSTKNLLSTLYYGTGQKFFSNSMTENPTPALLTDKTQRYMDLMTAMLEKGAFFPDTSDDYDALKLFMAGQLPFYIGEISDFFQFTNKGFDWGILPFPKIDSSQKDYGGAISQSTCAYVVPSYSQKKETGYIIQAMNAIYYGGFDDALINNLFLLFVCDTDTLSMVDIISKGTAYDFSEFFKTAPAIQGVSADVLYDTYDEKGTLESNLKKNTYELTVYLRRHFKIEAKEEDSE